MSTSSLTKGKTPEIIVAEIRMMNTTFKGVHFLVEGPSDSKFWKAHVYANKVSILICQGKPNLLGASELARGKGLSRVVGVYDPDFDRLLNILPLSDTLVQTDQNDLELTFLVSDACKKILDEFGDEKLIADFERENTVSVLGHLQAISRQFGQLRFLSNFLEHRINFDRLSPYRFVSENTWRLDRSALISEYASLAVLSVENLESLLQTHTPTERGWCLSQGHDSMKILAQGLRRRIGKQQISDDGLLKIFRIAYSKELLQKSLMYKSLRSIEQTLQCVIFDEL
jgi:hypothetical protein